MLTMTNKAGQSISTTGTAKIWVLEEQWHYLPGSAPSALLASME